MTVDNMHHGAGEHGAHVPPCALWGHRHGGAHAQGAVRAEPGGGVDEVHHGHPPDCGAAEGDQGGAGQRAGG